jgi:hypothetical protein
MTLLVPVSHFSYDACTTAISKASSVFTRRSLPGSGDRTLV